MEPREGLLTFRAEGNNISSSRYHSRKIHWPGASSHCNKDGSGVTIGRGYDMKFRPSGKVISDLTIAGVPLEKARQIAKGSHKSFCSARDFVKDNREQIEEITETQQVRLFELIYKDYVTDSIRFYNRYKSKDSTSWVRLHKTLKDVFIDMKYQGSLDTRMVPIFGLNDKEQVIQLIRGNPTLLRAEAARHRVDHIKGNM